MSQASNYSENKIADHFLGTASWTMPSAVYVGLFTTDPGEDNSGTEVSGSGYARQELTFGAASGGVAANDNAVDFDCSGGDWGAIPYFALFDASSGGNQLGRGQWNVARTILDGDSFLVAVGAIVVQVQ